ncbi:MAG: tripartite tricarboxylate transporter substrate binding protein, partial [Chloroflexi bacterium]|nr:tripartite tricarboxylate transporter substrate binding protein [Chloroflexota bacterium]
PTKAVTVIHGFKPGGGSDQLAAVTQPVLEKMLKQRFVNVYKPGADGAIAWKEVGKDTKPDGYTLTTLLTPKTQLNSMVNRDAGYSMADFEPIVNIFFDPGILVVAPDSKYKSLSELIDAAKKAPGTIRVSHSGEGGDDWYNALMIEKLTGAKFNLIPFDGDAPAMQAAMGGHVDAATTNVGVVTGLVRGKKLRGLAVYTQQRLASISEVPTLKELGVNLVEGSYRGYLAPKGTPKEIIKILADALEKVSKDPQFLEACAAINMIPQFKRDQELKTFLDEEDALLRKVAKDMKLIQ